MLPIAAEITSVTLNLRRVILVRQIVEFARLAMVMEYVSLVRRAILALLTVYAAEITSVTLCLRHAILVRPIVALVVEITTVMPSLVRRAILVRKIVECAQLAIRMEHVTLTLVKHAALVLRMVVVVEITFVILNLRRAILVRKIVALVVVMEHVTLVRHAVLVHKIVIVVAMEHVTLVRIARHALSIAIARRPHAHRVTNDARETPTVQVENLVGQDALEAPNAFVIKTLPAKTGRPVFFFFPSFFCFVSSACLSSFCFL